MNNYTKEERLKDAYLMRIYQITLEDFRGMLLTQEYRCAICNKNLSEKTAIVDHNHKTGKVRAIVCHNCNRLLGEAKEDIKILQLAILYLSKF